MTSPIVPGNAYTDSPQPAPHWLLGAGQLFIWLLFHPSAWQNFAAHLEPALAPDFVLVDLKSEHWRNLDLRRILLRGYLIWPLWVGLLIALVFLIIGRPDDMLDYILAGTVYTLAAGLAVGLTISVAGGLIYGLVMGLLVGLVLPFLQGQAHSFIYSGAASIASSVLLSLVHRRSSRSFGKHVVGFVVAILINGLWIGLIYNIVSGELFDMPGVRVGDAIDQTVEVQPGLGMELALILGVVGGLLYGLVYGLIVWRRSHNWPLTLMIGSLIGLAGGLGYGAIIKFGPAEQVVVYNIASGVSGGLLFAGLFAIPYLLARYLAGIQTGAIMGALIGGVSWIPLAPFIFEETLPPWSAQLWLSGITLLLGLTLVWWRPVLLYVPLMILNRLLYRRDERLTQPGRSLLRFHSAFWDEFQRLPLIGLEGHLILAAECNPLEGQAAINYLTTHHQRWAAQEAQIELFARQLERCIDIKAIQEVHGSLTSGLLSGPANLLLSSFSLHSRDIKAALSQAAPHYKRQALNEVANRLHTFSSELNLTDNPYAVRFHPIAIQWYHIVVNHLHELGRVFDQSQEIDNPYIFSSPLSEKQGVFVGRVDFVAHIEQYLWDARRPPLLLYGQRRMGKTSLLRNLGRLLPSTIVPLFVDGQGAALADNYADYLYSLSKQMIKSAEVQRGLIFPPLPRQALAESPFIIFSDWLDEVEQVLDAHDKSLALLALDELEALKRVTDKDRFDIEDLLSLFRNLMQHRPKFKVVLAGSQTLEEFRQWASYLINMEVLKISYLEPQDALKLIEQPIPNFALRYEPEVSRHVLNLTRGHPHLIQLLCHEIVMIKNKQPAEQRRLVSRSDVEAAVSSALDIGNLFFADIRQNQVDQTGLALLCFLAGQGQHTPVSRAALAARFADDLDPTLTHLLRRDLIEQVDGGYRFQVELIRAWFEQLRNGN